MKQLIIVKPNTVTKDKMQELKECGFVVLELDDPNSIKIVIGMDGISGNIIAKTALETIQSSYSTATREEFAKKLLSAIKEESK